MYLHFSGILVCFRDVESEGETDSVNYTLCSINQKHSPTKQQVLETEYFVRVLQVSAVMVHRNASYKNMLKEVYE
jgi:hypothetical protein